MSDSSRILREDDPEHAVLLAQGWTVTHRSWGARLVLAGDADLGPMVEAAAAAQAAGYELRRLVGTDMIALRSLDEQVAPDFPDTPASHHDPVPTDLGTRLDDGSSLGFVAVDTEGEMVAYTWMGRLPDRWEVDRTGVAAAHRRRGLARAVKAASILATYALGARCWGTGGAGVNTASLTMNRSLGFVLEPQWHTLAPPGYPEAPLSARAAGGRPQ
ncbi:hypothetical protein HMPREF0058_1616 [Actinomyces urogenitalis DSM 15434]|uniref:N-acetyltransferase domain-containing protein n=1 Tax=Actinomyces urogenitalis DSM 15434 TaxID=525246 RepID=C0W6X2_9ACTO|nr:GNAT family N-acetyltransferase [Actinomyces urogenitalis]EEH65646.1 hypothetical protein HMPREF0058_1616 [Actinomyces urogenitalis DSM 15434]